MTTALLPHGDRRRMPLRRWAARLTPPLLVAGAAACGGDAASQSTVTRAAPAAAAAPVLLAAETVTVAVPLTLTAQLYSEHDTWLYARSTGVLESLFVDLGSAVHAGDVVARLESADQAIALRQAEVAWEASHSNVLRARSLADSKMMAPADSEQAELDFQRADLARAQARRNLALTRVAAPFDGAVAARSGVREGRLVNPGDSIVRITALAPLRASLHVPEGAAAGIRLGTDATVTGAEGSARGRVIRAAPGVDAASGTREFILELAAGSGARPGATVTVRIGGVRRRVVAVPAAAVSDSGFVLVWQDGRSTLRAVTLGARLPDGRIEIASGLSGGERLVAAPTIADRP